MLVELLLLEAVASEVDAFSALPKIVTEGVAVAAVITVVILFLRRQKESQQEYQAQVDRLYDREAARTEQFMGAIDKLADKIDRINCISYHSNKG